MSLSIASLDLPERVQRIIDGVGAEGVCCSQCGERPEALLRCSRCKIAKYCSEACQKQHFAMHKQNCRSIHEQQKNLEREWASLGEGDLSQKCINLADHLVKTGYRESDSISQASRYYREALKYYLLPMTRFPEYLSPDNFPWAEDCILLLMLVLGGDHTTMNDWCTSAGSERLKRCYLPANELDCEGEWDVYDVDLENGRTPNFELAGYATDDVTFQALQLLGKLKVLNEYNTYSQGLEVVTGSMEAEVTALGLTISVEDLVNHIATYLVGDVQYREVYHADGRTEYSNAVNCMVEKRGLIHGIINAQASIEYHGSKHAQTNDPTGGMGYLLNLVYGTFDKDCAPAMFGGGQGNLPNYYWLMDGRPCFINKAPPECWMIFRDAFAKTSGLRDLLVITMGIEKDLRDEARDDSRNTADVE